MPVFTTIITYVWELFRSWIYTIFVIPFQNTEMLWLLVPVWLGWFFSEFFQEKTGTSMGNAMSNAVIILWASVDCARQTVRLAAERIITDSWNIVIRYAIIATVFVYGILLVYWGLKGNKLIKRIGRVRAVTYVFVIFTPVFYNAIEFSWNHIIAAALFFPLFYFAIELIDRYTPDPKAIIEDMNESANPSPAKKTIPRTPPPRMPPRAGFPPQYRPPQQGFNNMPPQPRQYNPYNPYNRYR